MAGAYGIVISTGNNINVEGLQDYRPVGAFSYLGRYRMVDFPVSNLSNSGIDRIQVYVSQNPRSLAEHLGSGTQYNINPKKGKLQLLFNQDSRVNKIYNTDTAAFLANMNIIERMQQEYVIVTTASMIFKQDFQAFLKAHIESGADISLLYQKVNDAKTKYQGCQVLDLNRHKGLNSICFNTQTANERNVFMETYVMRNDLFIDLIKRTAKTSSVYSLADFINEEHANLDIRGLQHKGYFAAITDLKSYYDANLELLDIRKANELFTSDWPIYTVTTDSCPVEYKKGAVVRNSMVANGCIIEGTVENSVIGRGVIIKAGAVVRNSLVLGHTFIDKDIHIENQIIDKWASIRHVKEITADASNPGYVKRDDVL